MTECKETAAKRRRASTRLENLGIPEEELLRQQQELFARARESALLQERLQLSGETNSINVAPSPGQATKQYVIVFNIGVVDAFSREGTFSRSW